jgi:toxin ParE1/3/4
VSLRVIFTPEARAEYDEARQWYTDNRPAGMAGRFTAQVRTTLRRIAASPRFGRLIRDDVRRAGVLQFPYVVFYRPRTDHVLVVSVFHTSRDPAEWERRV